MHPWIRGLLEIRGAMETAERELALWAKLPLGFSRTVISLRTGWIHQAI